MKNFKKTYEKQLSRNLKSKGIGSKWWPFAAHCAHLAKISDRLHPTAYTKVFVNLLTSLTGNPNQEAGADAFRRTEAVCKNFLKNFWIQAALFFNPHKGWYRL